MLVNMVNVLKIALLKRESREGECISALQQMGSEVFTRVGLKLWVAGKRLKIQWVGKL